MVLMSWSGLFLHGFNVRLKHKLMFGYDELLDFDKLMFFARVSRCYEVKLLFVYQCDYSR
jgi:hypothetical protein